MRPMQNVSFVYVCVLFSSGSSLGTVYIATGTYMQCTICIIFNEKMEKKNNSTHETKITFPFIFTCARRTRCLPAQTQTQTEIRTHIGGSRQQQPHTPSRLRWHISTVDTLCKRAALCTLQCLLRVYVSALLRQCVCVRECDSVPVHIITLITIITITIIKIIIIICIHFVCKLFHISLIF